MFSKKCSANKQGAYKQNKGYACERQTSPSEKKHPTS